MPVPAPRTLPRPLRCAPSGPPAPFPRPRPVTSRAGTAADRPRPDPAERLLRTVGDGGGHLAQGAAQAAGRHQPARAQGAAAGRAPGTVPVHCAGGPDPDHHPHRHAGRRGAGRADRRLAGQECSLAGPLRRPAWNGAGGGPDHLLQHRAGGVAAQAAGAAGARTPGGRGGAADALAVAAGQPGGLAAQRHRARPAAAAPDGPQRRLAGHRRGNPAAGQRRPRTGRVRPGRAQHAQPGDAPGRPHRRQPDDPAHAHRLAGRFRIAGGKPGGDAGARVLALPRLSGRRQRRGRRAGSEDPAR